MYRYPEGRAQALGVAQSTHVSTRASNGEVSRAGGRSGRRPKRSSGSTRGTARVSTSCPSTPARMQGMLAEPLRTVRVARRDLEDRVASACAELSGGPGTALSSPIRMHCWKSRVPGASPRTVRIGKHICRSGASRWPGRTVSLQGTHH